MRADCAVRWAGGLGFSDDSGVAPGERGIRNRTAEGRNGLEGVGVGSMVIVTGLAAGRATAGAAASDGRSCNAGNGAVMAGPGGRRQARVRRVGPVGLRVAPAGDLVLQVAQRLAARGVPQAVIADLVKAGRQDVLEEAPDELVAGHSFSPLAVGGAVLVAIGHGRVVDRQDAVVGWD